MQGTLLPSLNYVAHFPGIDNIINEQQCSTLLILQGNNHSVYTYLLTLFSLSAFKSFKALLVRGLAISEPAIESISRWSHIIYAVDIILNYFVNSGSQEGLDGGLLKNLALICDLVKKLAFELNSVIDSMYYLVISN